MTEFLSPSGERRRGEILDLARRAARHRRYRRRGVRTLAIATAAACAFYLAIALIPRRESITHPVVYQQPTTSPLQALIIHRIPTDLTLPQRLSIAPQPPQWQTIDDEQLIRSLADDGESVGFIRTGDQTLLLSSSSLVSDTP